MTMLYNYLKIALRNIAKNKLYTIINITGLSLGIASVFLMMLYVRHEIGYDKFYPEYQNLYRISWENENPQTRTPHPMAQAMVTDFPEVESAVSLSPLWAAGLTREIFSVRNPEKGTMYDEAGILAVDSTFFDVFGFPVVRGNAAKALRTRNGILISESIAKKYFPNEDPIGKHLSVNAEPEFLEVMAVFKDVPVQSHFHFDMLVSYVREKSFDPEDPYYTWADFGHFNYVRLKPGADPKALEARLLPWIRKYFEISDDDYRKALAGKMTFRLQPVADIHLKSHLRWELEANGNLEYVYIMSAGALLILLVACINFMNLMTAKSVERAKEIGIRKTLGAMRHQLSTQFLGEAVLITVLSLAFALMITETCLPFYNSVTGQTLHLNYWEALPLLLILTFIIGLASGIYPAIVLSTREAHSILKGKLQNSNRGRRLRNSLIVFQFSISMILISTSAIIYNQLDFIQNKTLGFNRDEILVIPIKKEEISSRMEALKTELNRTEGVVTVTASSNMPGGQFNQNSIALVTNPDNNISAYEMFVDYDFVNTMGLELAEGRFLSREDRRGPIPNFVINEAAARQLSTASIVGKEIYWHASHDGRPITGRVVGVVKDFHFQSLHDPLRPLIMIAWPAYNHLVLRLNTQHFDASIAAIEKIYRKFDDSFAFEFAFLDERLNKQYDAETHTAIVFTTFALVAIGVASFGLFGMAMLTFQQRTKEVSIRKVLGASVAGLMVILLSDFTKLITLAVLLATPVAWWMMDRWLNNFVYQVDISPSTFVLSGLSLVIIAWVTLSYLTLRASQVNPTETLKGD